MVYYFGIFALPTGDARPPREHSHNQPWITRVTTIQLKTRTRPNAVKVHPPGDLRRGGESGRYSSDHTTLPAVSWSLVRTVSVIRSPM